jgi:hypothetical protein
MYNVVTYCAPSAVPHELKYLCKIKIPIFIKL